MNIEKPRHKLDMCKGKKRYKSKYEAFRIGRVEMRIRKGTKQLYTYDCPICGGTHITHDWRVIDLPKYKIV
jgi:hypothetical protein